MNTVILLAVAIENFGKLQKRSGKKKTDIFSRVKFQLAGASWKILRTNTFSIRKHEIPCCGMGLL